MGIREKDDSCLSWVHFGDLHISTDEMTNYRDFQRLIQEINCHLAGHVDFCVLPGDNANDGTVQQFELLRRALDKLAVPVHIIPGDHDRISGDLGNFYGILGTEHLPTARTFGHARCIFLDVVSHGSGGPDFQLGHEQMRWLERELDDACNVGLTSVVFMHAYPADLARETARLVGLFQRYRVKVVDMGHTHYNEVVNDGTTIYATTRSTGQVEEGPVGLSMVTVREGVVNWRFKPLSSPWPFVMITSPADFRLTTDPTRPDPTVVIAARAWSAAGIAHCRCRISDDTWVTMHQDSARADWRVACTRPATNFNLTVEAIDAHGHVGSDRIEVEAPGQPMSARSANGGDADTVGTWPDRHLLGTRLGPNRNGRQW